MEFMLSAAEGLAMTVREIKRPGPATGQDSQPGSGMLEFAGLGAWPYPKARRPHPRNSPVWALDDQSYLP